MKLKIRKSLDDYVLKEWAGVMQILQEYKQEDVANIHVEDKIKVIALFSGKTTEELRQVGIKDINNVFSSCLEVFLTHVKRMPPLELTINGKVYERILSEKGKTNGGWYIDVKTYAEEFKERPELIPALNYIEKGMQYSQTDKKGHTLNPTSERAEIFKEHFPANVFIDLSTFFLEILKSLTNDSLDSLLEKAQTIMTEAKQEITSTNG
jgi:hypothetical protein